jgi:hypothetical protein
MCRTEREIKRTTRLPQKRRERKASSCQNENRALEAKQVGTPTEIIWSDGRFLHTDAHTHIYSKERQTEQ